MAFNFSKKEPVGFGDLQVMPEVSPEKQLRLQDLKITSDNLDEARSLISSCFGPHAKEVDEFMKANLYIRDYFELRAYLLEGARGLAEYRAQVSRIMDAKVDEAMEKVSAKSAEEASNNA